MARPKPVPMEKAPRKEHPYEPESATVTPLKERPAAKSAASYTVFSSRVHPDLVRAFKMKAIERDVSVQDALTEAMSKWVDV